METPRLIIGLNEAGSLYLSTEGIQQEVKL